MESSFRFEARTQYNASAPNADPVKQLKTQDPSLKLQAHHMFNACPVPLVGKLQ
jgi:hypothetical protein